jgi:hypothetical protein
MIAIYPVCVNVHDSLRRATHGANPAQEPP